jgi:anti-sigma factor RsiW
MNRWNRDHFDVLRYLDKELSGQEREDTSIHLRVCTYCRARLEEEQALSRLLQRSRPLYSAPAALRAKCRLMVPHRG